MLGVLGGGALQHASGLGAALARGSKRHGASSAHENRCTRFASLAVRAATECSGKGLSDASRRAVRTRLRPVGCALSHYCAGGACPCVGLRGSVICCISCRILSTDAFFSSSVEIVGSELQPRLEPNSASPRQRPAICFNIVHSIPGK